MRKTITIISKQSTIKSSDSEQQESSEIQESKMVDLERDKKSSESDNVGELTDSEINTGLTGEDFSKERFEGDHQWTS